MNEPVARDWRRASLPEVQKVLLQGLLEFDRIANQLKIDYLLVGGSALGSFRHGGFIPWDDDVDVAIPAAQFDRFVSEAASLLGDGYVIHTRADDPVLGANAKIYIDGTKIAGEFGAAHNMQPARHSGLFVDIFVLADLSDSAMVRKVERVMSWVFYIRPWSFRLATSPVKLGLPARLKYLVVSAVPPSVARRLQFHLARPRNRQGSRLCGVGYGGLHGVFSRRNALPTKIGVFEGHRVRVPGVADGLLREYFGDDFMTLPDEESRPKHADEVWIKRSARGASEPN